MLHEPVSGGFLGAERQSGGWIEVICGSMFSGKTEELIRRLNRAIIARQKVEIFKPALDNRYHEEFVVSHDGNEIRSTPVQFASDIFLLSGNCDVVAIDEAQFFDPEVVNVSRKLANMGKRVIVAGLDMDYLGKPFAPMNNLMAVAEFVTKMHAICMRCGAMASFSFRIDRSEEHIMLGEKDIYEARCRKCFIEGMTARKKQKE